MTKDRLQPQRQRGRPRKVKGGDDISVNQTSQRRREGMRKAQEAHRLRQQEFKSAQEQKIATLEGIIEQMSSIFGSFADSLLNSEVLRRDQNSLNELYTTMNLFVAVARRAEKVSGEALDIVVTGHMSPDHTNTSIVAPNQHTSPYGSEIKQTSDDHIPADWQDSHQSSWTFADAVRPRFSSITTSRLLPLSNVFGNGWPSQNPTHAINFRKSSYSAQLERPNEHSIALKLVQGTLNIAYDSLLHDFHNPTAIARRMFRYALLTHSREELLFRLRWFLGPGYREIHLLRHASFGDASDKNDQLGLASDRLLRPEVDSFIEQINARPFLSASEIEEYLVKKGALFLDPHRIEISWEMIDSPTHSLGSTIHARSNGQMASEIRDHLFNNSTSSTKRQATANEYMENTPLMPPQALIGIFNFNAIVGDTSVNHEVLAKSSFQHHDSLQASYPYPKLQRYVVQVSTLVKCLVKASACLGKGPGYERAMIDDAIITSVIL
ncbi:hypothetical protein BP5796_07127 [Coleophoma crateriformis]|uniref:BZIP domain-containing protein n=1 Tax=Coleophoma crateriformis TaxID=565419 RepID=A0A3D8RI09_9HELO|nr:hypothetical protein BP5796_07127 [Coleophoma crateriformis]